MEGGKMKVSVIIPVYNQKPEYFKQAVESVFNQTVKPHELIVVNDGSDSEHTNKYNDILENPPIKVIIPTEPNKGIGYARQKGVDEATGDYIAFLSSDDIWDPKFLEVMIKTAKEQPGKILYSFIYFIDGEGNIMGKFEAPSYDTHEDFCMACFETAYKNNMFVNFSTTFFPKKVFEKCKFKYRFGEDLYFLLISMKHFQYHLVPQYLLKYRAVGNLTSRIRHKIPENNEKIIKEVREYWENGK